MITLFVWISKTSHFDHNGVYYTCHFCTVCVFLFLEIRNCSLSLFLCDASLNADLLSPARCWKAVWTRSGGSKYGSPQQAGGEGRVTEQPWALLQGPVCPQRLRHTPAAAKKWQGRRRLTAVWKLNWILHLFFANLLNHLNLLLLLQGLTKQYPVPPVVDNELLQMSMRLFRRTMAGQASGPERSDGGSAPAADVAAAGSSSSSKLTTAQPEVCVSWKKMGLFRQNTWKWTLLSPSSFFPWLCPISLHT